jgi:hypothetical protein
MSTNVNWIVLTAVEVDRLIATKVPGTYLLSRGRNVAGSWIVHYVGRSDDDLNHRLKQHIGRYTMFGYHPTTSAKEAFELECTWYHEFKPVDNVNHPAVPVGTSWRCPVGGCPYSGVGTTP